MNYLVTEHPNDPKKTVQRPGKTLFQAVNPLDALDQYSVAHGYSRYSDIDRPLLDGVIGSDQYGVFASYENTTLWAIRWPPEPLEVTTYLDIRLDVTKLNDEERSALAIKLMEARPFGVPGELEWNEVPVETQPAIAG